MRILNKFLIAGMLISAVYYLGSCGSSSSNGSVATTSSNTFTASLTVAQEVPAPPFLPTGSGSVTLDPVTKVLSGSFTTVNVANATAAHIHDGNVGVQGPVAVGLTQSAPGSATWQVPANTILTDAQIARLQAGGLYVNVHTTQNTGGEIRGQLVATVFNAALTVAQEVPAPTIAAGATPSGSGSVTIDPVTKIITGSFTTVNVANATLAHIHDGNVGVPGSVVVPLTQSAVGSATWNVPANTVLTDVQIARLQAGGFYVNIHTTQNPSGEIRGQLVASGFSAALTVAQEVPAPAFQQAGSGSVTLDPVTKMLTGSFTTVNVANATLAHIHDGDVGVAGPVVVALTQSAANTWSVPANTLLTDAQIARLRAGGYYVNVHTTQSPGGEIRGQLAASSITSATTTTYTY